VAIGAYIAWALIFMVGLEFLSAVVLTLVISFFLGVLVYKLVIQRVIENLMLAIICTMMISTFVENAILLVWPHGALLKRLPSVSSVTYQIGFLILSGTDLVYTLSAFGILAFLWFMLKRTKLGLAMRSITQDKDAASLMGISIPNVSMIVVGISSSLAAFAGILLGSKEVMLPTMGSWPMWKASLITLFGGPGRIKEMAIAAFIISETELIVSLFLGYQWANVVLFLILMVWMVIRKGGV